MIRSISNILLSVALWLGGSWLLYNSVELTLINEEKGTELYQRCFPHGMALNAIIFFGMLYLFPRNEGRWSHTFRRQMLLLFFGVTLIEFFIDNLVLGSHGIQPAFKLLVEFQVTTVISNLIILGMGLFTGLVLDWFYQHRLAREIRMEQVQTELDLLKSRINPHFLFNALNGIFYMAHKKGDEETADAIARLSQMMRYMLQDVSRERVPLEGELEYLENFVAMQRMRLADAIPIEFSIQGEPGSLTVPPMMLLPFVENAFKHGVSNANPTAITIQIQIGEGRLHLAVDNHVHPCAEQETGGFGLKNAQRRLELLYSGKHRLEAGERDGRYRVRLSLEGDGVGQNTGEAPPKTLKERGI